MFVSNAAQAARSPRSAAQAPQPEARDPHGRRPAARARSPWTRCAPGAGTRSPRTRTPCAARGARSQPDDLATIIYTSGTTGEPKGVMLTHGNIVSNVLGAATGLPAASGPTDLPSRFLPLCHIFERMAGHYLMLHAGATIAYAESVEQVPANMAEVRPHRDVLGAAPLREDVRARAREGGGRPAAAAGASSAGRSASGARGFRHRVAQRAPGPLLRLQATRSPTGSSSRRSRSARAAGCACSSPAARRSRARSRSSSAPRAS